MNHSEQHHDYLLSVVATSRNDNHGGNLLVRMQHFIDGFLLQCDRHHLSAELIIVEWNPPEDKPSLSQVLRLPTQKGNCAVRIITVPKFVHDKFEHGEKLPLYQMIAKNVGIRRAKGKYILATNIDILFNDKLIRFMKKKLSPGIIYRVDRYDVNFNMPSVSNFEEVIKYCKKNAFRLHTKYKALVKVNNKWIEYYKIHCFQKRKILFLSYLLRQFNYQELKENLSRIKGKSISHLLKRIFYMIYYSFKQILNPKVYWFVSWALLRKTKHFLYILFSFIKRRNSPHTNACGDFTLASSDVWQRLRGYPEWDIFSWHIDSVFLHQAQSMQIKEKDLPIKMAIYHMEHGVGSGYTPEDSEVLFSRLEEKEIPYLSEKDLFRIRDKIKDIGNVIFNADNWGFSDINLPEITIPNDHY